MMLVPLKKSHSYTSAEVIILIDYLNNGRKRHDIQIYGYPARSLATILIHHHLFFILYGSWHH